MPKSFQEIKDMFLAGAHVSGAKTNNPVVVALVGVTGVGNSTIARALHKELDWPVVVKNKIRVMLREKGKGFSPETTDAIFYAAIRRLLRGGGNMILDSDFVEKRKRRKLEKFARAYRARVIYIRLVCDEDVTIGRIIHSRYNPKTDLFPSAAIALREHMRRMFWHYRWSEAGGGSLDLRRLPIKIFAEVDTARPAVWKKRIRTVAGKLQKM